MILLKSGLNYIKADSLKKADHTRKQILKNMKSKWKYSQKIG